MKWQRDALVTITLAITFLMSVAARAQRGLVCRLIDAQPAPLHWDRATVVHPRSLEVFESLGLLEPFLAAGVKQRIARLHSGGRVLGEIDLSTCGSRYGFNIGISEEVTEAILADYLRRQGGEIVRSSRLVELQANESGLGATIARDGSTEEVAPEWVVGCDGRARNDGAFIEATTVLTTRSDDRHAWAWLAPAGADQLGIGEVSLLVVRPDGHVGLRADRDHLEALAAYHSLLAFGRTSH